MKSGPYFDGQEERVAIEEVENENEDYLEDQDSRGSLPTGRQEGAKGSRRMK